MRREGTQKGTQTKPNRNSSFVETEHTFFSSCWFFGRVWVIGLWARNSVDRYSTCVVKVSTSPHRSFITVLSVNIVDLIC